MARAAIETVGELRSRFRRHSLLVVSTALYLAAIAGTLYTIETAYYLPAKWDLIRIQLSDRSYIDSKTGIDYHLAAIEYASAHYHNAPADRMESIRGRLKERGRAYMDASPTLTALLLETTAGEQLYFAERRVRLAAQHNFSNSILTRSFERQAQQTIARPGDALETYAVSRVFVTTALGNQAIERLTNSYRAAMLGSVGFLSLIYYMLLILLILPLSRLLACLEMRQGGGSTIIASPRSHVERAYNSLARDASLTRLSKELREIISGEGLSHVEPFLDRVPRLVENNLGIVGCQVWAASRRTGSGAWQIEKSFARELTWFRPAEFAPVLETLLGDSVPQAGVGHLARAGDGEGGHAFFWDVLDSTHERLLLFVVQIPPGAPEPAPWWIDCFSRVGNELRYAIFSVEEQRRMILAEKSKANVSLSRNLGHDLTNIIATSKLELMNVKMFLSMRAEDVRKSPAKEQIFRESLEALLNNTRFLQEIVNLYRSFSYIQKPRFEEVDIAELVEDVSQLYRLSVSRHIRVETRLAGDIPPVRVEPRLLRLALFNLLTNAAEAIKRATSADNPAGSIVVSAQFDAAQRRIAIAVEDTGTGICDRDGNLLNPDQLSEIFRLGFSTKANQEGEGLGLNWVQTIVREFHGGEIVAANRPGGGASFAIRLPTAHHAGMDSSTKFTSAKRGEEHTLQEARGETIP